MESKDGRNLRRFQEAKVPPKNRWFKSILIQLGLVLLSALLFAGSFPNLLVENGLPLLAWFAYLPVLLLIKNNSPLQCAGWGAIYGLAAYSLFNYWLSAFHPLAGTIVYSIYIVYLAAVFLLLKLADIFFPRRAYLVQWLIWLAYEFLRTKGFLGYSYGITGYSQWRVIPLIQIASITGVWGVCALVTFPSFALAQALRNRSGFSEIGRAIIGQAIIGPIADFVKRERLPVILWAIALAAALIFGFTANRDFSSYPTANIALVQQNTDPWKATKAPTQYQIIQAYRKDLQTLKRLSDEALASTPKPDMVVWAETAFVPRIYWHTTYRDDQDTWLLVRELLDYLHGKDVPFLIGNDDARMDMAKNPDPLEKFRVDYNAALFFENGELTETYRKIHLVPFTEHFPYKKQFPFIYDALKKQDTHFWEKGDIYTVFRGPGFAFSTPICFEDTFGYLSRNFVRAGADLFVNISNDAWAESLPSQNQHLSMAVFRAVENNRSMVRSSSSGQTCAIDPRGRVTAMARPFTETWLNITVPIVKKGTFYTLYGDYLALIFSFMAVILLLSGAGWCTINKLKRG
jgi:apolipoprotein N-acyltransferase